MEVQMKDTLPGVRTYIGNESIATFINTHFVCKFLSCGEKPGKYRSILKCEVSHRSNVLAGGEQNVLWRFWVVVHKRHYMLILIDDVTGYRTSCNLAEQKDLHTKLSYVFILVGCCYQLHWKWIFRL